MFKSTFARYLTTFTVIIALSFLALFLIVSSIISNYSIENKKNMMEDSAEDVKIIYENYMRLSDKNLFEAQSGDNDYLQAYIGRIANNVSSAIFITDKNGNLITSTEIGYTTEKFFNEALTASILAGEKYEINDLGGLFSERRRNYFAKIEKNGEIEGIILITSSAIADIRLTDLLQKTMIAASLWVFLAAMISVYITSRKITEPLKNIAAAAKQFGKGDFNSRVDVVGHDEIAQLSKSFNNMASALAKTEEMRSSFLGNVAHDLRTPMTVITGYIDGILDGTIPLDKQNYYLEIISTEVRRLSRLVTTLLELSRVQNDDYIINPVIFNLSEKTRQILLSFEKKIDAKKINIEFDDEPDDIFVTADNDSIHQVVYNLIDNAVKFTPEAGLLEIHMKRHEKKCVFKIKNSGEGIPPDEIPYIFERFYKSDRSRGLDKHGTGLGLFIVKTTLNLHGEDIEVNSEFGKNCEFIFTLPLTK